MIVLCASPGSADREDSSVNTEDYATARQISKAIVPMIAERDWKDSGQQAKYISRVAVLNIVLHFISGELPMGDSTDKELVDIIAADYEQPGVKINDVLRHLEKGARDEFQFAYAPLTKVRASALISWLSALPRKAEKPIEDPKPVPVKAEVVELEDGIYKNSADEFVKVYHTQKGHQVGKVAQIEQDHHDETAGTVWQVEWIYVGKSALKGLKPEHKLTLEQAREFGMIYGSCVVCARTLTDELSIALGIGPVCGKREFGSAGFKEAVNAAKLDIKEGKTVASKSRDDEVWEKNA
jgi:hypothetical protein